MGVDIRFPIGLMFTILGLLLTLFGLFSGSNSELYKISYGVNINLWTGLFSLVFGLLMLGLSLKGKKKVVEEEKQV
jgi:hypothetical protein